MKPDRVWIGTETDRGLAWRRHQRVGRVGRRGPLRLPSTPPALAVTSTTRLCGETFSDDVVAAAMIDRLVHHTGVLTLSGDSSRSRARRELLIKDRARGD